jgi:hypothetical protein
MFAPIMLALIVIIVCAFVSFRHWQIGDTAGAEKAKNGAIACAIVGALMFWIAIEGGSLHFCGRNWDFFECKASNPRLTGH